MKNLYTKLFAVQKEIKAIKKDETNPHFKSKYFTVDSVIEELRPILNKVGLLVMQPLQKGENGNLELQTNLIDPESGEVQSMVLDVPQDGNIQHTGANLTYLRRYALTSLFLIEGETDNDGNSTAKPDQKPPTGTEKVWYKKVCTQCKQQFNTSSDKYEKCFTCNKAPKVTNDAPPLDTEIPF